MCALRGGVVGVIERSVRVIRVVLRVERRVPLLMKRRISLLMKRRITLLMKRRITLNN